MNEEKIKIVIIDDSVNWVKQLTILLTMEDDMIVVGSAHEAKTGYEIVELTKPDVVLLDLYLDENPSGIPFISRIKDHTKIIITTMSEDPAQAKEAILLGAKEFVVKESIGKLTTTIREVHKRWTTAEIIAGIAKSNAKLLREKIEDDLLTDFYFTNTEKQVFKYMKLDLSRREIARRMFLAEQTIKNHIRNILKKLAVSDTKEAVAKIQKIIG
jgi:DNA-binding NarL/FixJ family response regulator